MLNVKSWEDADTAARRIWALEREIEKKENAAKEKIDKIKQTLKEDAAPLQKESQALTDAIADFFFANEGDRDEKTKGQKTLTHAKLSSRDTTNYRYPSPLQTVIDKCKKLGLSQFIRVKEEVNKERISAEATPDQLKALGIKKETISTVHLEPL